MAICASAIRAEAIRSEPGARRHLHGGRVHGAFPTVPSARGTSARGHPCESHRLGGIGSEPDVRRHLRGAIRTEAIRSGAVRSEPGVRRHLRGALRTGASAGGHPLGLHPLGAGRAAVRVRDRAGGAFLAARSA
ncbi:hypothetical protein LNKW23_39280 [Paralimibaculum aggregatum]|uniref:Uncharacterized protein n=1 Tax=Paralimibaculum aggregatum TaxID=3036245 RepID=A0ABQ6LR33_9RHOB|nr:hypothetical protein LNKW23_39280 [Limibaculum sp. NKW23]